MVSKHRALDRILPALGLALIVSLALVGAAAGSASAATQHWYSCAKVTSGLGTYSTSACDVEGGSKTYKLNKLTAPSTIAMSGQNLTLSSSQGGLEFLKVTCSSQSAGGTIENPTGGAAGTLSGSVSAFGGCIVSVPRECLMTGGGFKTESLKGEATEFEGKPALKFSAGTGFLFGFNLEGCASLGMSHAYYFSGSFIGFSKTDGVNSYLEFTKASSKGLSSNIGPAWFTGKTKITNPSGEALRLAP